MTEVGYRNQLNAVLTFDASSWIAKINTPCLVISADQDIVIREPDIRQMAHQIPNASYYCFHNAGHLPSIEQPQKFIQIVKEFIRNY